MPTWPFTSDLRASDNPLIGSIAAQHWRHLRRVMGAVLQTSQRDTVWDEHEAIARRSRRAWDAAPPN
jgi:DNA-binding FadR family transcriptional regulator